MSNIKQDPARFLTIYNRTEKRVKREIEALIKANDPRLTTFIEKDILDVAAIACSALPAKYVHKGTIVISDNVSNEDITQAIGDAISMVHSHPKT